MSAKQCSSQVSVKNPEFRMVILTLSTGVPDLESYKVLIILHSTTWHELRIIIYTTAIRT